MHDSEISKKWSHAVAVWWAMMWRIALGFFVVMFVAMHIGEFFFPFSLAMQESLQMGTAIFIVPLGVYATRAVLNKNFGNFRVALVPSTKDKKNAAAQKTKIDKKHTESDK